jgi:hypothetical protein
MSVAIPGPPGTMAITGRSSESQAADRVRSGPNPELSKKRRKLTSRGETWVGMNLVMLRWKSGVSGAAGSNPTFEIDLPRMRKAGVRVEVVRAEVAGTIRAQ